MSEVWTEAEIQKALDTSFYNRGNHVTFREYLRNVVLSLWDNDYESILGWQHDAVVGVITSGLVDITDDGLSEEDLVTYDARADVLVQEMLSRAWAKK